MLVLLPPSEAKQSPNDGAPLDLSTLSLPGLTPAREHVVETLVALCSKNLTRARSTLGLTANQDGEIVRNAALLTEPAGPALSVFTGVLFAHLHADGLGRAARGWLDHHVLIASGLLGFVSPADHIPAYRLAADVTLPKLGKRPAIGGVATYWRAHTSAAMSERAGDGLVLDCRSQQYVALWQPDKNLMNNYVSVRVLQRSIVKGEPTLKVVSHHNKATKGLLVHALAKARVKAKSPQALLDAVRDLGFESHLEPMPTRGGAGWRLDVITE